MSSGVATKMNEKFLALDTPRYTFNLNRLHMSYNRGMNTGAQKEEWLILSGIVREGFIEEVTPESDLKAIHQGNWQPIQREQPNADTYSKKLSYLENGQLRHLVLLDYKQYILRQGGDLEEGRT